MKKVYRFLHSYLTKGLLKNLEGKCEICMKSRLIFL